MIKKKKKKKSNLQKRKENYSSSYHLKCANRAWGAVIHTIYDRCALHEYDAQDPCSGKLEAHHLINREHKATCHDIRCGILLCSKHHRNSTWRSPHNAPHGFDVWLEEFRPKQWAWVKENVHVFQHSKPDYKERAEALERMI